MYKNYDAALVRTVEELLAVQPRFGAARYLGFDFETASLTDHTIWGVCMACPPTEDTKGMSIYIGCEDDCELDFDEHIKPWIVQLIARGEELLWIGQNLKFDTNVLRSNGFEDLPKRIYDTMIGSWMLTNDEFTHNLGAIAKRFLKIKLAKDLMDIRAEREQGHAQDAKEEAALGSGGRARRAKEAIARDKKYWKDMFRYGVGDGVVPLKLYQAQKVLLDARGLWESAVNLEMRFPEVIGEMEIRGVPIDKDYFTSFRKELVNKSAWLDAFIRHAIGKEYSDWCVEAKRKKKSEDGVFNTSSAAQLSEALFDSPLGLMLDVPEGVERGASTGKNKNKPGPWPTNGPVLKMVDHQVARDILELRSTEKLLSTYIDNILLDSANAADGRVRGNWSQIGTRTGRFTCTGLAPLMTLPRKRVRVGFIPSPGFTMMTCDYSQIELRLMAHVSGDKNMMAAYHAGADIHRRTASWVLKIPEEDVTGEQRQLAKACIAEGQPVLTDRGLVPIEDVLFSDLLWDGVEWVSHGGVVCRGYKGVMTYDGLTATPDHKVYLQCGGALNFYHAAKNKAAVAAGADGVTPLVYTYDGGAEPMPLQKHEPLTECAYVYDIVNAGPRHRFTVSGKVVFNCNFGFLYGQSAKGFVDFAKNQYGVAVTLDEATLFRKTFFDSYRGIVAYHDYIKDFVKDNEYTLNLIGERRNFPDANSKDSFKQWKAFSDGTNYTIQGSAAAMIKIAMLNMYDAFYRPFGKQIHPEYGRVVTLWKSETNLAHEVRMFGQVHDEVQFEVRDEILEPFCEWVKYKMETAMTGFRVPIVAEYSWGAALQDAK